MLGSSPNHGTLRMPNYDEIAVIIISLAQILLSYIANTSRTHARRTHARTHTNTHTHTHTQNTHTHTHTHTAVAAVKVIAIRLSLSWRQCRSLAIEINTRAGDPIFPRFWLFFA